MANIVWLRRDLRLHDNPALHAAAETGEPTLVVYIHAPHEEAPWAAGAASLAWLHHSLQALQKQLKGLAQTLIIRRGDSLSVLRELISNHTIKRVFWQRLYDPIVVARDAVIKAELQSLGVEAKSFAGYLLHEPWDVRTLSHDVYRVFTPYWRNCWARLQQQDLSELPAPGRLASIANVQSESLDSLKLTPTIPRGTPWDQGFWQRFAPGEKGANAALELFCDDALRHYHGGRDRPDQVGTSRLSAHLHFGEISPRTVANAVLTLGRISKSVEHAEFYVRELGWRDFSHQLLFNFPTIAEHNLNPRFNALPWAKLDDQKLHAWQRGQTGIPIIDAGMRELWQTGWMHNRVRMLVASYLCKNLRFHWEHGARWFWDTLVDANLANNTQGWQWSAGTGADAAPYFRIFNPVTQAEKFDPNGNYVRQFVPELASLKGKDIHQPWKYVATSRYPKPIVDLAQTRADALSAFATLKSDPADT